MITLKPTSARLLKRFCKSQISSVKKNHQPAVSDLKLKDIPLENEPVLGYLKGSEERTKVEEALLRLSNECSDVPIVIGGQEHRTDHVLHQQMPFNHAHKVARFYYADKELLGKAITTALAAKKTWDKVPLSEKIDIFLRAADLISKKYRHDFVAATMLGQGKTVFQAEIDAAAELIDFLRFNAAFVIDDTRYEPLSPSGISNKFRQRAVDGFVAAISPFNFTAIGGNLAFTPTLTGNTVLWKPSDTAVLSNYLTFKVLQEAGMPPGVVNFVPADGPTFGDVITHSPDLGAINFTGSVPTFQWLWRQIGNRIETYKQFPRLVGECGGKNFHLIHPSADVSHAVNSTIRGAFEYSGQKCSATSRLYVPMSLWPKVRDGLVEGVKQIKVDTPLQFDTFMSAVIDSKAYQRIRSYLHHADSSPDLKVLTGGSADSSVGFYVQPTFLKTSNPLDRIMKEEIFGPVLTAYVYPDKDEYNIMELIQNTTDYSLTGAVFAEDHDFLVRAAEHLRYSCGNFYINDKSTGAVVGQQPFGGSRLSGTNDKAGAPHYISRWTSYQSVKQNFTKLDTWKYQHMEP